MVNGNFGPRKEIEFITGALLGKMPPEIVKIVLGDEIEGTVFPRSLHG